MVSDHKPPVRWEYNNRTLKEVSAPAHSPDPGPGLQHRMLVGGRVLEVSTLQGKFAGRYRCQTFINSTRQILSAWIYVHSEGECLRLWTQTVDTDSGHRDAFPGQEVFKCRVTILCMSHISGYLMFMNITICSDQVGLEATGLQLKLHGKCHKVRS